MNQSYAFPSWSQLGNAVVLLTSASLMEGQVISLKNVSEPISFILLPVFFFSLWSYLHVYLLILSAVRILQTF